MDHRLKPWQARLLIAATVASATFFATGIYGHYKHKTDTEQQVAVVQVVDGDTVKILRHGEVESVRLYGIDAPEKLQEHGTGSWSHLAWCVQASTAVYMKEMDRDRYGRIVAVLWGDAEGQPLNRQMIDGGHAWVYNKYCKADFCDGWRGAENVAKAAKRGLWADAEPVPPWEFRRR